jgi:hypothetical protein
MENLFHHTETNKKTGRIHNTQIPAMNYIPLSKRQLHNLTPSRWVTFNIYFYSLHTCHEYLTNICIMFPLM